jgi:hypothetical protein
MKRILLALLAGACAGTSVAQTPPAGFQAGRPTGVTLNDAYTPTSANVKIYGAIVTSESCVYDPARKLIVMVNRGAAQTEAPNDGFVSLLRSDGTVHTIKWIGATRNGLTLNEPFGSDVHAGKLYLADSDGATADGAPRVSVIRIFDLATGAPAGEIRVEDSPWFNDLAIAADGTIYATQSGSPDGKTAMRVYKITPDGKATVLIEGAPLAIPNGIALDRQGNLVVVNIANRDVLTFSPQGKLLKTEQAAQGGNDGIVIMPDGTKYISSVREGGIQRLRPGGTAELIATGVPTAASMCFDPDANQLVIPLNPNNAVALVKL